MPSIQSDYCGIAFERNAFEIAKTKHHFCSRKCFGKWKSEHIHGPKHPTYNIG